MQYEAEFTSLSRYAPHYASTQEEKCHKFFRGLRDQLQQTLTPFDISDFIVLVERARRIENELNFSKYNWEQQQPEQRKIFERDNRFRNKKPNFNDK
ncbi:hypothetical protein MA16_Dca002311 [Dendrobium catenatum]|uniref:Retrotransposon gag domain-containing protein n=1 Tax=Dendrobium catenatum TaxID=906689 RepID=A0A2I0W052_9ASPA|nr:hypothetical protein MA16_Dca002311 [Dendrobium catenatum]